MSLVCGQQSSELRVHCHQHDELHSVASSDNKLTHTLLRFNLLGKRQLCWYHVRPHRMHAEHKCGLLLQPTTWFMCPCVYLFACWPQPWSVLKPTNRHGLRWNRETVYYNVSVRIPRTGVIAWQSRHKGNIGYILGRLWSTGNSRRAPKLCDRWQQRCGLSLSVL